MIGPFIMDDPFADDLERTRASYAHGEAAYDEVRGRFDTSALVVALRDACRSTTAPGHLLDLGCGTGQPVATWFQQQGWAVTGVDYSPGMIAAARAHLPDATLIEADLRSYAPPTEHFDAIACVYSLFHLGIRDQFALLARCYAALKPGGAMLFTYASKHYTGEDRFEGMRPFPEAGIELFYAHATPDELKAELERLGFALLNLEPVEIGGETFLWVLVRKPAA